LPPRSPHSSESPAGRVSAHIFLNTKARFRKKGERERERERERKKERRRRRRRRERERKRIPDIDCSSSRQYCSDDH